MIKSFSDFVNEDAGYMFDRLIMDKKRWLSFSKISFDNAVEDEEIEPAMEDYYLKKYMEASGSAWKKITDYLGDDTPVYLELYASTEWLTDMNRQQQWQGVNDLLKTIESMVSSGEFSGVDVLDMAETEPAWIPVLTELDGERIVVLIENPEADQYYGGGYALVPRKMVEQYIRPQLN